MSDYTFKLSNHTVLLSIEDADLAETKLHLAGANYVTQRIWDKTTKTRPSKKLHRIILERKIGRDLAANEIADHINGNTLDNRRENIRLADKAGNCQNAKKRKDNKSGFKGVSKKHSYWIARIQVNGKPFVVGKFDTPEKAYIAYCEAAKKYHGEFARLG